MPVGVEFGGAEPLRALSRRAERWASSDVLPRELESVFGRELQPDVRRAVQSGTRRLPKRGGFAARAAQTELSFRPIRRADTVGVRIKAEPGEKTLKDPQRVNRGRIRHPTFGDAPWVLQNVPGGFFTEPLLRMRADVGKRLEAAKDRAVDKF